MPRSIHPRKPLPQGSQASTGLSSVLGELLGLGRIDNGHDFGSGTNSGTNSGNNSGNKTYPNGSSVQSLSDYADSHFAHNGGDGPNTETTAFAYMLNRLFGGSGGYDSIAKYIENMSQNALFTDEIKDQVRTLLFQMLLNQDQRQWDVGQLADSRNYNSPANELARLMGAGFGRDASMDILRGTSATGSAGGSASATAPAIGATSGTMDFMKKQANRQFGLDVANTAIAGLCQLLNCGVELGQGIEQMRILDAQANMSQAQAASFDSANNVMKQIQQLQMSGVLSPEDIDSWSNANDMYHWLYEHQDTNGVKPIVQSGDFSNAFGTIQGRGFVNQMWKGIRDSRDQGTIADEFIKQQKLENTIRGLQPSMIGAQMKNINSDTLVNFQSLNESVNRIAVGDAQIQYMSKEGKWLDVQGAQLVRKTDSEINLLDTQAYGEDIKNRQLMLDYEYNSAGFPMMKQNKIDELTERAFEWSMCKDPEIRRNKMLTFFKNSSNAYAAAYLEQIRINAVGDFAATYPDLYALASLYNQLGVDSFVRTGASVVTHVPFKLPLK